MGETEIKSAVLNNLLKLGRIDLDSLVFSEMNLAGKVRRLDLGYVKNNEFIAIEIKSEKDTLLRLPGQIEEYKKYFDKVIVAAAEKHIDGALALADDSIAIWQISSSNALKIIRKGRLIKNTPKENYLELMTKREISLLAKKIGINPSNTAMYELKQEVMDNLHKISKSATKEILLNGLIKRFSMPSNRFLTKTFTSGKVLPSDIVLLSPYLKQSLKLDKNH